MDRPAQGTGTETRCAPPGSPPGPLLPAALGREREVTTDTSCPRAHQGPGQVVHVALEPPYLRGKVDAMEEDFHAPSQSRVTRGHPGKAGGHDIGDALPCPSVPIGVPDQGGPVPEKEPGAGTGPLPRSSSSPCPQGRRPRPPPPRAAPSLHGGPGPVSRTWVPPPGCHRNP
jgi:hypothetical protein